MDRDGAQGRVQAGGGVGNTLAAPRRDERGQGDGEHSGGEQSGRNPGRALGEAGIPHRRDNQDDEEDEQRQDGGGQQGGLTGCRGQLRGASGLP